MSESDLSLVVSGRTMHGPDVVVLDLANRGGAALPVWQPGAHIDLDLGDGIVRQYSLCGDPRDLSTYRVGVLLEPAGRGGSQRAHALTVGETVDGRGPRNHFALEPARRYLFVAGGIGITPLIPMIRQVDAAGAEWHLAYGGRARQTMAFLAELEESFAGRLSTYPQDEVGLIDLARHVGTPTPDTAVYACGPGPLLDAVESATAHWPAGILHVERFTPKDVGTPVRNDAFEIELRQSGLTLAVSPDRTILDVVTEAGVDVMSSCTEGTCGTCETVVLDGRPDHRDSLLSAEEQQTGDTMMICVSRSISDRLVLDL